MRNPFPVSLSRFSLIVHAAAMVRRGQALAIDLYWSKSTRDIVHASWCRGNLRNFKSCEPFPRLGKRLKPAARIKSHGDAAMHTTWKPHEKHGELTERSDLPDSVFA